MPTVSVKAILLLLLLFAVLLIKIQKGNLLVQKEGQSSERRDGGLGRSVQGLCRILGRFNFCSVLSHLGPSGSPKRQQYPCRDHTVTRCAFGPFAPPMGVEGGSSGEFLISYKAVGVQAACLHQIKSKETRVTSVRINLRRSKAPTAPNGNENCRYICISGSADLQAFSYPALPSCPLAYSEPHWVFGPLIVVPR